MRVGITKENGDFFIGFGKWVRDAALREDDEGSIDCGPEPRVVGVPP